MIDFNSIMRAAGEIYVNKNYEYLFPHNSDEQLDPRKLIAKNHGVSRSDSNSSLSSLSNQAPNTPKTVLGQVLYIRQAHFSISRLHHRPNKQMDIQETVPCLT